MNINHRSTSDLARKSTLILAFAFLAIISVSSLPAFGQGDIAKLRADAFRLMDEQKYTEALPLLEKLAGLKPDDPDVQRHLGFALLGQAKHTSDAEAARRLRVRARAAFIKSKESGDDSPLVSGMIDSIAPDGGSEANFTENKNADALMQKAEMAFTSGKMDEALALYQQALKVDPKLYYAALFSGDVYTHKNMYPEAEVWYQRAITIDPYIETAYRYSATPLMKQGKHAEARDRYVEAWIVQPYSKFAIQGIVQWGQITGTSLGHPRIEPPEMTTGPDGKATSSINVNASADDGSMAWLIYVGTREIWKKEKFAKAFPSEKVYRHSVNEEADALRSVVKAARDLKPKKLNEQIDLIDQLDKDGLLEAYVIMAAPDAGIARDHAGYLRSNRDKLRQYVVKYVIGRK